MNTDANDIIVSVLMIGYFSQTDEAVGMWRERGGWGGYRRKKIDNNCIFVDIHFPEV